MLVKWVTQVLDVTWTDGPSQAAPPSEPPPPPPPDDDSDSDASEQPQSLPAQEEVGKALCTHKKKKSQCNTSCIHTVLIDCLLYFSVSLKQILLFPSCLSEVYVCQNF